MRLESRIIATAVFALLAGCGGAETAEEAPESEDVGAPIEVPELSNGELLGLSRDELTMTLPWGNGRVARDPAPNAASPTLLSLDPVGSTGFDRLVFEFSTDAPYPGYSVEWATTPLEGCSENTSAEGEALLRVTLGPVMMTDENGRQTVPATTNAGLDRLTSATRACMMEDRAVFELSASTATEFRVLEMAGPSRLVVDLRAGGM